MILSTVSPDRTTETFNDEEVNAAVHNVYRGQVEAVILVADEGNNEFMQLPCGGQHIEHCVGPKGPIYSAENVEVELAAQMFLAYAKSDDAWKTAVVWKVEIEEL